MACTRGDMVPHAVRQATARHLQSALTCLGDHFQTVDQQGWLELVGHTEEGGLPASLADLLATLVEACPEDPTTFIKLATDAVS